MNKVWLDLVVVWVGGVLVGIGLMLLTGTCKADTIGVHMGSVHSNNYDPVAQKPWNNTNPGVYYVFEVGGPERSEGLSNVPVLPAGNYVVGTYYNSVRKQSVYAGLVYPLTDNIDITVGVISGYNGRGPGGEYRAKALMPMVVPSVHFPITDSVRGRVHFAPGLGRGSAHAVHFSLEMKL